MRVKIKSLETILSLNGRLLTALKLGEKETIEEMIKTPIMMSTKLLGGKGGFGSMLRSMGSRTDKTRNKDACRGLDGRRIRETTIEKK